MTSQSLEQSICQTLRGILAAVPVGTRIVEAERFGDVLRGLDMWIADIAAEVYPEWQSACGDGIIPALARKTGEAEVEIVGVYFLLPNDRRPPPRGRPPLPDSRVALHLQLQIAPAVDEFSWLECRLADRQMHSRTSEFRPHCSRSDRKPKSLDKVLYGLEARLGTIDWMYKVTYGTKRP